MIVCVAKLYVLYICLQSIVFGAQFSRSVHVGRSNLHTFITELAWFFVHVIIQRSQFIFICIFICLRGSQMICCAAKLDVSCIFCFQSACMRCTIFKICSCRMSDFPYNQQRICMILDLVVIRRSQILLRIFFILTWSRMIFCAAKLYGSYISSESVVFGAQFSRSVHVGCSIFHTIIKEMTWLLSRSS